MKVLVVLPFAPWPVRVRCSNLWPRVAREAEVHVTYLDTGLPAGIRPWHLPNVASVQAIPFSSAKAALRTALALPSDRPLRVAWNDDEPARRAVEEAYRRVRPDVVYAERLRAVPLVKGLPAERLVLDPTDSLPLFCEEVRRRSGAPWRQRLIEVIEQRRLVAYERKHYARATAVVACSPRDAEAMRRSAPDARVEIVANGVDLAGFPFAPPLRNGGPKVLMSGNFGYWPNKEAAGWLLRQARSVRALLGGEVVFVGANPPSWMVRAGARGDVQTVGFVPDLSAYYHAATAVAAPVRFAVGSQNKVLEAMACGRPVVTTPQCAQGLAPGGRSSVVEARREEFVDALGVLLGDSERRRSLAQLGRAYVERHHNWDDIAAQMTGLLTRVAGGATLRRAA